MKIEVNIGDRKFQVRYKIGIKTGYEYKEIQPQIYERGTLFKIPCWRYLHVKEDYEQNISLIDSKDYDKNDYIHHAEQFVKNEIALTQEEKYINKFKQIQAEFELDLPEETQEILDLLTD
jgi:hypothetical protein